MTKPLTKALHTTRVVERIARSIVATHGADERASASALFASVLDVLDNLRPVDGILDADCLAVCERVLAGVTP